MKTHHKKILFFCLTIFFSQALMQPGLAAQQADLNTHVKQSINDGWLFYNDNVDKAESVSLNDSDWESLYLPHTWNAHDAFNKYQPYRRGTGWYRKYLEIDSALKDKKLFLFFEGVNQTADVFINGIKAGRHVGGYTAFIFDITGLVQYDKKNIIAVKVDNSHNPEIPPLNADYNFYGGIYRDVWLITVDNIHIDLMNYASPGIFISASKVSRSSAEVKIKGKVLNENSIEKNVKIINRIIDNSGVEIFAISSDMLMDPGSSSEFEVNKTVGSPRLWSPESPNLYKVITEIYENDKIVDEVINSFGIRWLEMVEGKGMYLNGKPLKLYGTNRHQDYEGLGNALPDDYHRNDIKIIKENGFNFLRLAHYPQNPAVLNAADEKGLILWEEIPVVNLISISENFNNNCEEMLIEMIRQHYNHPSIFIWGFMNEVLLVKPDPMPEGYVNAVKDLAGRLNKVAKLEDPFRYTAIAFSSGEIVNGSGMDAIPDIMGMNLYFGWYYNDLKTFGDFLDNYHRKYFSRNIIISEYGAGSDERIHTDNPKAFDFSTEYQQLFHESTFKQIKEKDYLVGSAIWNQFDFGSSKRQDSRNGINQKGIYFFNRKPKDISFYYKSILTKDPIIYIASREWNRRVGNDIDSQQIITVYSNLDQVELFINGNSAGIKNIENAKAVWNVSLCDGKNLLEASSPTNNEIVKDILEIFYEDDSKIFEKNNSGNIISLNSGSHYQYTDGAKTVWKSDDKYWKGGWGYKDGRQVKTQHSIFNTDDDPLYQTALENVNEYQFDLPDGIYEVQLNFCEIISNNSGERVFDVLVNDIMIFKDLDLFKEYKKYFPVCRKIILSVKDGKGITIKFIPKKGESIISGILVKKY